MEDKTSLHYTRKQTDNKVKNYTQDARVKNKERYFLHYKAVII